MKPLPSVTRDRQAESDLPRPEKPPCSERQESPETKEPYQSRRCRYDINGAVGIVGKRREFVSHMVATLDVVVHVEMHLNAVRRIAIRKLDGQVVDVYLRGICFPARRETSYEVAQRRIF